MTADSGNISTDDIRNAVEEGMNQALSSDGQMLVADISSDLETLGGGTPIFVPTPKGASQFIFPNGTILRFDIYPGQYSGKGPHINLETGGANLHIFLK